MEYEGALVAASRSDATFENGSFEGLSSETNNHSSVVAPFLPAKVTGKNPPSGRLLSSSRGQNLLDGRAFGHGHEKSRRRRQLLEEVTKSGVKESAARQAHGELRFQESLDETLQREKLLKDNAIVVKTAGPKRSARRAF